LTYINRGGRGRVSLKLSKRIILILVSEIEKAPDYKTALSNMPHLDIPHVIIIDLPCQSLSNIEKYERFPGNQLSLF